MVAYFVIGPESSGTRMMCEAIIRSTGAEGSYTDGQPFDDLNFAGRSDKIVFRRSVPHGAIWYDLEALYAKLGAAGYAVEVVATDRDKTYMAPSQVKHGHVRSIAESLENIHRARKQIDEFIQGKPNVQVQYENFVNDESYRHVIYAALGIDAPEMEFFDGNKRYR